MCIKIVEIRLYEYLLIKLKNPLFFMIFSRDLDFCFFSRQLLSCARVPPSSSSQISVEKDWIIASEIDWFDSRDCARNLPFLFLNGNQAGH